MAGLAHEEKRVRDVAFEVLSQDGPPGLGATAAARAAIDRWGWREAFDFPHRINRFPLDGETVDWVLDHFEAEGADEDDGIPGYLYRELHHWLLKATGEVREARGERLKALARLAGVGASEAVPPAAEAMPPRTAPELFAEIEAVVAEAGAKARASDAFPHDEVSRLEALVPGLRDAPRAGEVVPKVREWLEDGLEGEDPDSFWRVGTAILAAGELRLDDAIPALLDCFDEDGDWINEAISSALARMGTPSAAERITDLYADGSWAKRLYLLGALERLRFSALEDRLPRLLEGEAEDDLRVRLAYILALYGTPKAVIRADGIAAEDPDDVERLEVASILYAQDVLAGNPPTARRARWLGWLEAEERRQKARLRLPLNSGRLPAAGKPFPPLPAATAIGRTPRGLPLPAPVQRAAPKVGRNDPCPCGSGRKFKKCCERNG
jgi:hypothetical protein